jgi:neutral ceramidase
MAPPRSWLRPLRADKATNPGAVHKHPRVDYTVGETVRAEFVSGYPNNNLRRGATYLEVQRLDGDQWVRIADDGDWATVFRWRRSGRRGSVASVQWRIPPGTAGGQYRLVHLGTVRRADGEFNEFTGTSRAFSVSADG